MSVTRLSISIPDNQFEFIQAYAKMMHKGKSQIIQEAIKLLEEKQLEYYYKMANSEIDHNLDITASDGLNDEAW